MTEKVENSDFEWKGLMEIGIVIVMLVALIAYGIIAASQGDGEIKGAASTTRSSRNTTQTGSNKEFDLPDFLVSDGQKEW